MQSCMDGATAPSPEQHPASQKAGQTETSYTTIQLRRRRRHKATRVGYRLSGLNTHQWIQGPGGEGPQFLPGSNPRRGGGVVASVFLLREGKRDPTSIPTISHASGSKCNRHIPKTRGWKHFVSLGVWGLEGEGPPGGLLPQIRPCDRYGLPKLILAALRVLISWINISIFNDNQTLPSLILNSAAPADPGSAPLSPKTNLWYIYCLSSPAVSEPWSGGVESFDSS